MVGALRFAHHAPGCLATFVIARGEAVKRSILSLCHDMDCFARNGGGNTNSPPNGLYPWSSQNPPSHSQGSNASHPKVTTACGSLRCKVMSLPYGKVSARHCA